MYKRQDRVRLPAILRCPPALSFTAVLPLIHRLRLIHRLPPAAPCLSFTVVLSPAFPLIHRYGFQLEHGSSTRVVEHERKWPRQAADDADDADGRADAGANAEGAVAAPADPLGTFEGLKVGVRLDSFRCLPMPSDAFRGPLPEPL